MQPAKLSNKGASKSDLRPAAHEERKEERLS